MKIDDLSIKLGMSKDFDVPFKMYGDYKVQLTRVLVGSVKTFVMVFVTNQAIDRDLVKMIRKEKGTGGFYIMDIGLIKNAIAVPISSRMKVEKIEQRMQIIANCLKFLNIRNFNQCPFCGRSEDVDGHRRIEGINIPVHNSCAQSFVREAEEKIRIHNSNKNNLFISVILAIIGGFIGALPGFLISIFSGYVFALLYALIALAAFYGYKIGKGPLSNIAISTVSIVTISVSLLMTYFLYNMIAIMNNTTFHMAYSLEDEFRIGFYSDSAMSLLFSCIGIWISWSFIVKRTTSGVKNKVKQFKG